MGMQAISQNPLYHHHHHHHHHEYIQRHLLRTYWRHLDDNVSLVGRVANKLATSLRGSYGETCVGVSGGNTVSFKITNTFDAHSPQPKSKKRPGFRALIPLHVAGRNDFFFFV